MQPSSFYIIQDATDDVGSGDESEDDDVDEMNSNSTCIKPEITHFPDPLINKETRQHGAIILHILLAIYVFIGKLKLPERH